MKDQKARISTVAALAVAVVALLTAWFARPAAAAQWPVKYRNVTAGGELRPGVYGRIEVGNAPPPPLIYKQPVVGAQVLVPPGVKPVYFYVPPGQVRRWAQTCAKWKACDVPVLFVRMDDSPSRLGHWKHLKDAFALRGELVSPR